MARRVILPERKDSSRAWEREEMEVGADEKENVLAHRKEHGLYTLF